MKYQQEVISKVCSYAGGGAGRGEIMPTPLLALCVTDGVTKCAYGAAKVFEYHGNILYDWPFAR